ncbi:MAG TPA: ABC transporter ATP-binding protein [Bacteroidales bacterium]|nr:ABC transporter ATP-binding protein [Bacteroidales bacterium]HPF02074.1 ABC transporter ATP-binding protein [Bacteroidales bacterium]HRW85246.1 ABC transporter ATP-binding protein [Bacteroidales bacterium]
METDPVIEVRKLVKRYKTSGEEALKGVSLDVSRGEFLGLLGPNSAGKTTFTSLICGLLRPTSGTISVLGRELRGDPGEIRNRMGLVPQEIALYQGLTVRENIMLFGHLLGLHGKRLMERADMMIKIFNLEEHLPKLIAHCSGGIKRRVNLICGIIHDPELLILDEPTLGVDTQLREMISGYLTGMNRKGTTVIYTTHYMKEAELLCSRVNIIDHGRVIADGKPADLISRNAGCADLGQVFLNLTGRDLRD